MRRLGLFLPVLFFIAISFAALAQNQHLTAAEAKDHIGEKVTVCGKVVDSHYAGRSKGQPTFLNLDERYPKQILTILIWGSDRDKFGDPETRYANKNVCVTGAIKDYKGAPEIVAAQPSQIDIQR